MDDLDTVKNVWEASAMPWVRFECPHCGAAHRWDKEPSNPFRCQNRICGKEFNPHVRSRSAPETWEPIALALSGGGHRAALFSIGALLAVVDRRLNTRVEQIASVSGGSITNAFVLSRCDFKKLEPGDLDPIAAEVVRKIVTDGLLTRRRILSVLLGITAIAVGVCLSLILALRQFAPAAGAPASWALSIVSLLLAALTVFMFAGRYIDRLIGQSLRTTPSERFKRVGEFPKREVEHVFCTTDLVTGLPAYISNARGGVLWRRVSYQIVRGELIVDAQRWDASALKLAEVVRASAGFPGIPPRRIKLFSTCRCWGGGRPLLRPLSDYGGHPNVLFLADGGLWNNLGTQVLREDGLMHGERGVGPRTILCVNASGALKRGSVMSLQVPGLALVSWMRRCLDILSANTVEPRAHSMAIGLSSRAGGRVTNHWDVVVDLREVESTAFELMSLSKHRYDIADADPHLSTWERNVARTCEQLLMTRKRGEGDESALDKIKDLLTKRPPRSWTRAGMIDYDAVDDVTKSRGWEALVKWSEGAVAVDTTLDRIEPEMARRLVARGYLNTFLMSCMIERPLQKEISSLANLPARIVRLLRA